MRISAADTVGFVLLLVIVGLTIYFKKLTVFAAITGGIMAIILYVVTGFGGVSLLGCFFILGTAVTRIGFKRKAQFGAAEAHDGMRKTSQVLANGGAASMIALFALLFPGYHFNPLLLIAGAFSAATADTVSSELGTLYGRRFFNVISFKRDQRGENGVVSLEGFLFGIAGSLIIAVVYALARGHLHFADLILLIVAGFAGNLVDSLLGATLERRGYIGNDLVNFLNTVVGVVVCITGL